MLQKSAFIIALVAACSDALEVSDIKLKHEMRKLSENKFNVMQDYLYKHANKERVISQEVQEHRNLGKSTNNISYLVYDTWMDYEKDASYCGYPPFLERSYRKPNERAALAMGHSVPSPHNCHNNDDGTSHVLTGCIEAHMTSDGNTSRPAMYEIDIYDRPDCKGSVVSSQENILPTTCDYEDGDVPKYSTMRCEYKYPFKDMPGVLYTEFDNVDGCLRNHEPFKFIHYELRKCFGDGLGFYGFKCENNVAKYSLYEKAGCNKDDMLISKLHERFYPNNAMDCDDLHSDYNRAVHSSLKCSNNHLYRNDPNNHLYRNDTNNHLYRNETNNHLYRNDTNETDNEPPLY